MNTEPKTNADLANLCQLLLRNGHIQEGVIEWRFPSLSEDELVKTGQLRPVFGQGRWDRDWLVPNLELAEMVKRLGGQSDCEAAWANYKERKRI